MTSSNDFCHSKRVCSVFGCSNSKNRNPDIQLYRFPGKSWEVERRHQWIHAVKKRSPSHSRKDDKDWKPTKDSRVCSAHFVGGKKSELAESPAYIPTIFATNRSKKIPTLDRFERLLKRRKLSAERTSYEKNNDLETGSDELPNCPVEVTTASIGCQTDVWIDRSINKKDILFCCQEENDASTQTEIYILQPQKPEKLNIPLKKDQQCGPEDEMRPGFTGYSDINSDKMMRQLAGVSCSFFHVLLNLIELGKHGQPAFYTSLNKENRLLTFLMKFKLGVSFCALAGIFHVHSTTVSRIFFQILETLTFKTKTWIFWPSRESVKKNLPSSFYKYPNCRCIIDCTEIPTDTPPTVEQRVLMYSNYKGRFTVKFLVVITPDGYICKISKGYGGRATDSFITNDCGFLNFIDPGDQVLADKGFPQIKSELGKRNATLVIPPFAFDPQFTDAEVDAGYSIASVRIHVERAIQRIKLSRILHHIEIELLPYIDSVMHMCCVIANSQPALIRESNSREHED